MKSGKKSVLASNKDLIMNLHIMKNLKTKLKYYQGKINTNFHSDKIQKEGSQCICLSVILIDSVYRTGKNYYRQVFLEECRYVNKRKKCLSILLTTQKFLLVFLMKKLLMKEFLMKKILMEKIKYKKIILKCI